MSSHANSSLLTILGQASTASLLCTILSLQLILDLENRALVVQCGEWLARTSTVLAVLPIMSLGALATIKFPARPFLRLLAWISVGLFGFLDLVTVTEKLSNAVFGGAEVETLTDSGILKRCLFIAVGACWIPGVSLGYVMWSCVQKTVADVEMLAVTRGNSRGAEAQAAGLTFKTALVWIAIHGTCAGFMLWNIPIGAFGVYIQYPDCLVPLLGVMVASIGLMLESRTQGQFHVLGSAVVVVGISYAFNAYLSCRYCGYVQGTEGRLVTVWKCPLPSGGILQVVDVDVVFPAVKTAASESYKLRAVRLGHSIMGGEWTAPESVSGLPIFSAFHLQAAAGAVFSDMARGNGGSRIEGAGTQGAMDGANAVNAVDARDPPTKRSLHVGLGVGGSVTLLQNLGFTCDCIELHPQMVHVAKEFFHLNSTVCQIGDANALITAGNAHSLALEVYDVIIVDIFSGDAGAVSRSGNRDFFAAISRASMMSKTHDQVLVVNYFGLQGAQLKNLYDSVKQSFSTVRVYRDESLEKSPDPDHAISNFVLVASNAPALLKNVALEHPSRLLASKPFSTVFADYRQHLTEVLEQRHVTGIKPTCSDVSSVVELARHWICHSREQLQFSGAHFRAMRSQFFM